MLPRTHTLFGIIFSLIVVYFFNLSLIAGIIIFLSSVLIDIDHYSYYIHKKKNWDLKRAYNWFVAGKKKISSLPKRKRSEFYHGFAFLHGIEILILLFIFGKFFSIYFYYTLIGFSFHLLLDITYQSTIHYRFDRISLIYDYIKFRKLKSFSNN